MGVTIDITCKYINVDIAHDVTARGTNAVTCLSRAVSLGHVTDSHVRSRDRLSC